MRKLKLGIVGATGLVGQTVLKVLKEENLINNFDLFLIASNNSAGNLYEFDKKQYKVLSLDQSCLSLKLDIVIFSAGDEISKLWIPNFVNNGSYVIDNSNAFRRDESVPLVVPEINGNMITKETKLIANPNCSTIQLVMVLDRLRQISKIEKVILSSYQSVSGAGKEAINDLLNGSNKVFSINIKNNIIAQIGEFEENGFCKEENKIIFETNKILNEKIKIFPTTVRVPVAYCHGESVFVEFSQNVDVLAVKNVLKCKNIKYFDKICHNKDCFDTNLTCLCRLRCASEREIMFFVFADNLRRGAAYNAVMILKIIQNICFNDKK